MRISDWSSDVCSSELRGFPPQATLARGMRLRYTGVPPGERHVQNPAAVRPARLFAGTRCHARGRFIACRIHRRKFPRRTGGCRSQERRVGQECVRACKPREETNHKKTKKTTNTQTTTQ